MDVYMVLKATGRPTAKKRSAVFQPISYRGKSVWAKGNIPELYQGMFIKLEVNDGEISDYSLELSDKNRKAIEKAGKSPDEYETVLKRHQLLKEEEVDWNSARLSLDEIYDTLSFVEADKVHKKLVDDAEDKTRLNAISRNVIRKGRTQRKIAYGLDEYLLMYGSVEEKGAYEKLKTSVKITALQNSEYYSLKGGKVWDSRMKYMEEYVKKTVTERQKYRYEILTEEQIDEYLTTLAENSYADEQTAVLYCLQDSSPCILTGGAGVGKTTVIKAIIECYSKFYGSENILLVAPTGKASRRLAEKTGMSSGTIHKVLRKTPEDTFTYYNEDNKLPHKLIIADESSMIDTELMYDLLSATEEGTKIIFVGDHNQLYPVKYGEPFFDFLSILDVYRLTENHRQAEETDILLNAERILKGEVIQSGRGVSIRTCSFKDIKDILDCTDTEKTQILSPYNALNVMINEYLKVNEYMPFCKGDKIIMLKNTKDYSNGDIGRVISVDKKNNITVEIDGRKVKVTPAKQEEMALSYAITIHKMQGSEAEKVIIFIPQGDRNVNKRLMYTAITRAKTELDIYFYEPYVI